MLGGVKFISKSRLQERKLIVPANTEIVKCSFATRRKIKKSWHLCQLFSELGGSRTHNRLIRSQGLYPIELLVHCVLRCKITTFFYWLFKKCEIFCGGGWTRTTELIRGQIYSLLQLPLCDSPEDFCVAKLLLFLQSATIFIKKFLKVLMI